MKRKVKKPTNKGKFSLYLDKTLMAKVAKKASLLDRSVNWLVENTLLVHANE